MTRQEIRQVVEATVRLLRESEPYVCAKKAADYLGVDTSWLSKHSEIPRIKKGKMIFFKMSDLDKWIEAR